MNPENPDNPDIPERPDGPQDQRPDEQRPDEQRPDDQRTRGRRDNDAGALVEFFERRGHKPPSNAGRIGKLLPPENDVRAGVEAFVAGVDAAGDQGDRHRDAAWDVVWSLADGFSPSSRAKESGGSPFQTNSILAGRIGTSPFDGVQLDENHRVVVWRYTAVHDRFVAGVHATNREITFDGVSIFDPQGNVTKFVDWNFVAAQLGLVSTLRPLIARDVDADGNTYAPGRTPESST